VLVVDSKNGFTNEFRHLSPRCRNVDDETLWNAPLENTGNCRYGSAIAFPHLSTE